MVWREVMLSGLRTTVAQTMELHYVFHQGQHVPGRSHQLAQFWEPRRIDAQKMELHRICSDMLQHQPARKHPGLRV
jgi:hypothetical protein